MMPDKMESPEISRSFRPVYRLRKTDEYSSVFAFRKAVRGHFFVLHYRPAGIATARLGVVVAKRLVRRAVQRNFVKRMARETFRHMRAKLPPYDMVLRLNVKIESASRLELREDLQQLFRRLPR